MPSLNNHKDKSDTSFQTLSIKIFVIVEYYSGLWNNDIGRFWFDEETRNIATLVVAKFPSPWFVIDFPKPRTIYFLPGQGRVPWRIQGRTWRC